VLGRNCRFLQGSDTDPGMVARMRAAIREGAEFRATLLNYRGPDREPWWNEIYLSPVRDVSGRVVQYLGVQHDVTARVSAERALARESDLARTYLTRIEQLAFTDALTGLPNRVLFDDRIRQAMATAKRYDRGFAVMYLDVDRFKEINDECGHAAGDAVLREVGARLRRTLRESDTVARFGGDEFVVLQPIVDGPGDAADLARKIVASFGTPLRAGDIQRDVRLSIGIALYPQDAGTLEELLDLADRALYAAKRAGRNRWSFADEGAARNALAGATVSRATAGR
jgi:diguanylate cyclase (GGDEF)-like protein